MITPVLQYLLLALSVLLYFAVRLYPTWHRRFKGCDAFNILLCTEILRKDKKLPIVVPDLFILEDNEQWYPPGFMVLCALLPEQWIKRNYWVVNHLVDFIQAALLALVATCFNAPLPGAALIAAYALLPGLAKEYSTLTTRPLGVLLFTLFLVSAYWSGEHVWLLPAALAFGVLLFYSHKLSMQQLWFTLPVLSLFTGEWRWLAYLPLIYLAAFAVWPQGFVNVLKGHGNIVRFWNRHWPQLGLHMVRSSPVYGDKDLNDGYYSTGYLPGLKQLCLDILHQNYFAPVVLIMSMALRTQSPLDLFLVTWLGSVYVFAILVYAIPALRGIGLAGQYIKYAHVPAFLHIAVFGGDYPAWGIALLAGAFALELRQYVLVSKNLSATQTKKDDNGYREVDSLMERLQSQEVRLLCLPVHLCDYVAYMHRITVYWGTHNQCFDQRLAAFFPVMQKRIEDYVADGGLTHLLLDTTYIDPETLKLDRKQAILAKGQYLVFDLAGQQGNA